MNHVCGLQGFDDYLGDKCPKCEEENPQPTEDVEALALMEYPIDSAFPVTKTKMSKEKDEKLDSFLSGWFLGILSGTLLGIVIGFYLM